MAITNIKKIHKQKNKSVKASLKKMIDYISNDEKTDDGVLVSSYMCDVDIADIEFEMSKKNYFRNTGRTQSNDVLAYSVLQSFFLDEVSPEKANEIGYKLAEQLTNGEHSFIVATHVNTDNIHTHILWNSTNLECNHKWKDNYFSAKEVAKASDLLCLQNRLSVIDKPQKREYKNYKEWKSANINEKDEPTLRQKLQWAIDEVLEHKPKSLEKFLEAMKNLGYENKVGKNIAFKFENDKKFIRLRSLDDEYSQENILKQIEEFADGEVGRDDELLVDEEDEVVEGIASIFDENYKSPINNEFENQNYFSSSQTNLVVENSSEYVPIEKFEEDKNSNEVENHFSLGALKKIKSEIQKVNKHKSQFKNINDKDISLLLDLQMIKATGKGVGYEKWAKRFNTEQLAKTMSFINENGLTNYKDLKIENDKILNQQKQLENKIAEINSEMDKVKEMQSAIIDYSNTKSVYAEYQKSGYSEKFKEEHLEDILKHKDAKKVFDEYDGDIPVMFDLRKEYATLETDRKKIYSEINQLKDDNKDLLLSFENVKLLLGHKYEEQNQDNIENKIPKRKTDER